MGWKETDPSCSIKHLEVQWVPVDLPIDACQGVAARHGNDQLTSGGDVSNGASHWLEPAYTHPVQHCFLTSCDKAAGITYWLFTTGTIPHKSNPSSVNVPVCNVPEYLTLPTQMPCLVI